MTARHAVIAARATLVAAAFLAGGPAWLWVLVFAVTGPALRAVLNGRTEASWEARRDALRRASGGLP